MVKNLLTESIWQNEIFTNPFLKNGIHPNIFYYCLFIFTVKFSLLS